MAETQDITSSASDYVFHSNGASHTNAYLLPPILNILTKMNGKRVFDLGCGNGALCRDLYAAGYEVSGCDPSESGIAHARAALPKAHFEVLGVYDAVGGFGGADFDVVISTEVVEHLFSPVSLPRFAKQILKPGGHLIVSTPYHGYLKNLALSIFDKWDFHHTPLWDGGHIKFWSRNTLSKMLAEEGFVVTDFIGTGRVPFMWKSMIIVAQRRD